MSERLLLVDDDEIFCRVMQRAFARRDITADCFTNSADALNALEQHHYERALVDLKIVRESGLALIKALRQRNPDLRIVMLTGYSSVSTAVEAIKLGATNYLCKPASVDEVLSAFEDSEYSPEELPLPTQPSLDRVEWEHIQQALQANQGNISATARALGMHRRTLQRKLFKRPSQQ
jgi:two-component system, response regulator RegA